MRSWLENLFGMNLASLILYVNSSNSFLELKSDVTCNFVIFLFRAIDTLTSIWYCFPRSSDRSSHCSYSTILTTKIPYLYVKTYNTDFNISIKLISCIELLNKFITFDFSVRKLITSVILCIDVYGSCIELLEINYCWFLSVRVGLDSSSLS